MQKNALVWCNLQRPSFTATRSFLRFPSRLCTPNNYTRLWILST